MSLKECNRYMLETGLLSDVTFHVVSIKPGSEEETIEKFRAHKFVLISRSSLFKIMFCPFQPDIFPGHHQQIKEVLISDINPEDFRQMLIYLYTDEVEITSNSLLPMLKAAQNYDIPGLVRKCFPIFEQTLNESNVCHFMNQDYILNEEDYRKTCLKLIQARTKECFETKAFLNLKHVSLWRILDSQRFNMKEVKVFACCLEWAKRKCKQSRHEFSVENLRYYLGNFIYMFRFLDCSIQELQNVLKYTNVLYDTEQEVLFRTMRCKEIPLPVNFKLGKCKKSRYRSPPYEVFFPDVGYMVGERRCKAFQVRIESSDSICIETIYLRYFQNTCLDETVKVICNGVDYVGHLLPYGDSIYTECRFDKSKPLILSKGNNVLNLVHSLLQCAIAVSDEVVLEDDVIKLTISNRNSHTIIYGTRYTFHFFQ